MLRNFILLAILAINSIELLLATQNPKTVCYYESWVYWRKGEGHMESDEIGKFNLILNLNFLILLFQI